VCVCALRLIESKPHVNPPHTHVPCKYRTPTAAFDALTSFIGYWTGLRLGAPSFCFCFDCCFWLAVRRGAHPFPRTPPILLRMMSSQAAAFLNACRDGVQAEVVRLLRRDPSLVHRCVGVGVSVCVCVAGE
jgi:hypothetical protein